MDALTPVAKAATEGIRTYFVELLNERRRNPRQDLLTHLVQAEINGVPLTEEDIVAASEVMGLMTVLFLGGVETTAGLTSTVFKLLAENPDQLALLRKDPSLIPNAVDEAVRYATPLQLVGRTTTRSVRLHGITIPDGARVVLVYGAANRDPRQFPHPDEFDVTRGRFRHLGFGEGMHGCLGRPLALLETQVAVQEALPLLGDYHLAQPAVRYRSTPNAYVWEHLHVTPGRGSAAANGVPPSGRHQLGPHVETVQRRSTSSTLVSQEFEADVVVAEKHQAADGVVTLTLQSTDRDTLPGWAPGAHVDLVLDQAPTRQYSLCGNPADQGRYRLGILRDPEGRGSSLYVHDKLQPGDVVRVRGPRNNFRLDPSPRYLFIAGGIGITPILPMIARAEQAGADWRLVYGGRQRSSMAFLDELAAYGDKITVAPQDETGLLDLDTLLGVPTPDTLVYCCGPEPLLAAVEQRCTDWPRGSLHLERFTPKALTEPVLNESFELVLQQSGLTLSVPPDRSILDVVEENGVATLSSCAEGTCGTCETPVLEGQPDHRDSVLSEQEREDNNCLKICVSRSCTPRLVLDL